MARTTSTRPQIEVKALAAESKSAGMRMLYDAGYSVAATAKVFSAPYGFAYGVALRHGVAETAAKRKGDGSVTRAKAKSTAKAATKPSTATKTPVARVAKATAGKATVKAVATRTTKVTRPARPADKTSASARVAAKLAAKQPGRPSPERRASNRKPRTATKA
jgi:hypothetical protein